MIDTLWTSFLSIYSFKSNKKYILFGVFRPTHWSRHHYRWWVANFLPMLALMAIEQRGFFSVSHLLCHRGYIYNGHFFRGTVTFTRIAERFGSGAVTAWFYDLSLSRLEFEHLTFRLRYNIVTCHTTKPKVMLKDLFKAHIGNFFSLRRIARKEMLFNIKTYKKKYNSCWLVNT